MHETSKNAQTTGPRLRDSERMRPPLWPGIVGMAGVTAGASANGPCRGLSPTCVASPLGDVLRAGVYACHRPASMLHARFAPRGPVAAINRGEEATVRTTMCRTTPAVSARRRPISRPKARSAGLGTSSVSSCTWRPAQDAPAAASACVQVTYAQCDRRHSPHSAIRLSPHARWAGRPRPPAAQPLPAETSKHSPTGLSWDKMGLVVLAGCQEGPGSMYARRWGRY